MVTNQAEILDACLSLRSGLGGHSRPRLRGGFLFSVGELQAVRFAQRAAEIQKHSTQTHRQVETDDEAGGLMKMTSVKYVNDVNKKLFYLICEM